MLLAVNVVRGRIECLLNETPRLRQLVPNPSCLVESQDASSWDSQWDSRPRYPILFDCSRHGGLSRLTPAV